MRWRLATALFDTDETFGNDTKYDLRGIAPPTGFFQDTTNYPDPYITSSNQDLLTGGGTLYMMIGGGHSVLDEFAIYDFGDTSGIAWTAAMGWADDRYADGRYYKEGDANFLSTILTVDGNRDVRVLKAVWTGYLPQEPRKVFTMSSQNGTPRVIDPVLLDDPATGPRTWFEVELVSTFAPVTVLQKLGYGDDIGLTTKALRYRVHLKTALEDPVDQPLLETPYFDDITFFWQPASGPRVLAWTER